MKLGTTITSATGQRGPCVRLAAGKAIGRLPDGTTFVGRIPTGPKPKTKRRVRVIERGEVLSPWLDAVRLGWKWKIVEAHGVWHGAVLSNRDVEVEK